VNSKLVESGAPPLAFYDTTGDQGHQRHHDHPPPRCHSGKLHRYAFAQRMFYLGGGGSGSMESQGFSAALRYFSFISRQYTAEL
jgi:hypothetical protein